MEHSGTLGQWHDMTFFCNFYWEDGGPADANFVQTDTNTYVFIKRINLNTFKFKNTHVFKHENIYNNICIYIRSRNSVTEIIGLLSDRRLLIYCFSILAFHQGVVYMIHFLLSSKPCEFHGLVRFESRYELNKSEFTFGCVHNIPKPYGKQQC